MSIKGQEHLDGNGQIYDGPLLNGLKHGYGSWRNKAGDSYVGNWKQGKPCGYGIYVSCSGERYEGQFRDCLKHGKGTENFHNGDIYKGQYKNGKFNGFGEYYWNNGSYFKGNFKEGLREGCGIWKKKIGPSDKYEGEYHNGKKQGYGIFTWESGNSYKGGYEKDMREGYGEMHWVDGSYYKGEWQKGIQNGKGLIYLPQSGLKKGIFKNNVLVKVEKVYNINEAQKGEEAVGLRNHPKTIIKDYFKEGQDHNLEQEKDMPIKLQKPIRLNRQSKELMELQQPRVFQQGYKPKSLQDGKVKKYSLQIIDRSTQLKTKANQNSKVLSKACRRNSIDRSDFQNNRIMHSAYYIHKLKNNENHLKGSSFQTQSVQEQATLDRAYHVPRLCRLKKEDQGLEVGNKLQEMRRHKMNG